MDLSGLWNQLLLNSTICVRSPSTVPLIQGIQIIAPYTASTNIAVSENSNSNNEDIQQEQQDDDDDECKVGSDDNEDITESGEKEDGDEELYIQESDESKGKRSIHRVRYSKEEYKCKQCPYTCTTEKAFLRHVRGCDTDPESGESIPRPLSCPICGKDRKNEDSLTLHMTKHKEDRYFCCDMCKFKSLQLKKLIQHRRMHTGEKPHLCPFCIYRSSRRDNLRSHVRRVHKKNDLPCDTFTPRSMVLTPRKFN